MEMARRRFTIADGMILIAATACGLAWTGRVWRGFKLATPTPTGSWLWFCDRGELALVMTLPCLLFLTIAVAILRVRRPRPSWRRIARQPGMTALMAALLFLPVALPPIVLFADFSYQMRNPGKSFWVEDETWADLPIALFVFLMFAIPAPGIAVIVAWTMLAVQGRWRNEPSWIDRAGRVLGVTWILTGTGIAVMLVRQMLL